MFVWKVDCLSLLPQSCPVGGWPRPRTGGKKGRGICKGQRSPSAATAVTSSPAPRSAAARGTGCGPAKPRNASPVRPNPFSPLLRASECNAMQH